jgi:hypothetical protein
MESRTHNGTRIQKLRFQRYATLFKEGLHMGLPHGLDLYTVLYDKGVN